MDLFLKRCNNLIKKINKFGLQQCFTNAIIRYGPIVAFVKCCYSLIKKINEFGLQYRVQNYSGIFEFGQQYRVYTYRWRFSKMPLQVNSRGKIMVFTNATIANVTIAQIGPQWHFQDLQWRLCQVFCSDARKYYNKEAEVQEWQLCAYKEMCDQRCSTWQKLR